MGKNSEVKVSGLLLCAGLSERMGEFKPLMLYQGLPWVVVILLKLCLVCKRVVIVTGHKADQVNHTLNKYLKEYSLFRDNHFSKLPQACSDDINEQITVIGNAHYRSGMFSSLQCGIKDLEENDWILYHFVDQPDLPMEFYSSFIEQIDESCDWIQPQYGQQRGHPILFKGKLKRYILNAKKDATLKHIRDNEQTNKKIWLCRYKQVLTDLDTKEELIKLENRH